MIRRHPFACLLVLLGLLLATLAWTNRVHLQAFSRILAAYSAKEYCSCRYVMGHPAGYCAAYVEQYLPLSELVDDEQRRRVSARGLGNTQVAQWLGQRQGCRLHDQVP